MKIISYIFLFSLVVFKTYGQTNQAKNIKVGNDSSFLIKTEQITLQTALQLTNLARSKASALGKEVTQ